MSEIKVPELGESITEGTINEWLKKEGDPVSQGEAVVELETDKINVEVTAEDSGTIRQILKQPGDTVKVGEVIATLGEAAPAEQGDPSQPKAKPEENQTEPPSENRDAEEEARFVQREARRTEPVASPAARRLARERGVDLSRLPSPDPMGRIAKQHVGANEADGRQAQVRKEASPKAGDESAEKPTERIRMSRRRQTIARHLVEAQQQAAMLTTFNEVDMSAVLQLRKRRKDQFYEKHGVKLGFMSFFTKAVVGALKTFPMLNAEIDGEDILLKKYYDIGIAVSTDEGLVVPVVRNADRLSFADIEREIGELAKKARDKKLTLEDLQGGTFTITNGGVFGSLLSTPILNAPQVGILGMHKIQTRPVAVDEQRMENRPMMYVALSYDHRIIDGREAVSFLVRVKELLEDPESLLLEG